MDLLATARSIRRCDVCVRDDDPLLVAVVSCTRSTHPVHSSADKEAQRRREAAASSSRVPDFAARMWTVFEGIRNHVRHSNTNHSDQSVRGKKEVNSLCFRTTQDLSTI